MADDLEKVLVVAGAAVDEQQLARELDLEEDTELKVVAPIQPASDLDLVTGDVDDSIAAAEQRAEDAAEATDAEVTETESGESDPLLAIEDALATFEADQIVLVGGTEPDAGFEPDLAEEVRDRFSLPVRELQG